MSVTLSDFDYPLPERLIAQHPTGERDSSRLLVLDRAAGQMRHKVFRDLPGLLGGEDLLVLNDTQVIPARFFCRRATGGRVEGLFLRELEGGCWEVLLRGAARCRAGQSLAFEGDSSQDLVLQENLGGGKWRVMPWPDASAEAILDRLGVTPLPPYIKRPHPDADSEDRRRYQTVYAARPGAVAAPTAGLHFTPAMLSRLEAMGVQTARVTLHVGLGTFAPVQTENLALHAMHGEWFDLPAVAAEEIASAKARGRRVVAVGTTSVRVLESAAARQGGQIAAENGWTDLFLYPPAEFRVVDALLTNFHLPRSTLLMLVAAFCDPGGTEGIRMILDAYAEAVRREYRFFSYGDAMLIL